MSVLSAPHFHNEAAAYEFAEARIWPNGQTCPHCGGVERISKMKGKSTRIGTYKCYQCRKAGKLSQQEQSERFKETARELGADGGDDAFSRALIVPAAGRRAPED